MNSSNKAIHMLFFTKRFFLQKTVKKMTLVKFFCNTCTFLLIKINYFCLICVEIKFKADYRIDSE